MMMDKTIPMNFTSTSATPVSSSTSSSSSSSALIMNGNNNLINKNDDKFEIVSNFDNIMYVCVCVLDMKEKIFELMI